MKNDEKKRDKKIQCGINREAAKLSASSGTIDKYEYLTSE